MHSLRTVIRRWTPTRLRGTLVRLFSKQTLRNGLGRMLGTTSRVKTPTVLQMEAVECGAAALAIILGYYKRFEPLETLRVACGVSRDGSKASNLLRAARTYGLTAKGYKVEPNGLREKHVPMIVHWNFNHFVVFEGFVGERAHLNDPAVGPRTVSVQEFDESFTGVALTFEPTEGFESGGRPPGLLRGLVTRLEGAWSALLYVILAGLALVIPGLLEPAFQKVFVDNVLIQGLADWVPTIVLAMTGTAMLYAGLLHLRQSHLLKLEMKMALTTSAQFFWHVLRLPVGFFTQRSSGDLSSRVGLNDRIARLLSNDLARNALNVVVIAFYGGLMLLYDAGLTLLVILVAGANVAALKYVSRRRTDVNMRLQQERGALIGTAMSGLQSIETLKATGAEADFFTRWSGHHAKVVNAQQTLGLYSQVLAVVPPFLIAASTALILGFGGMRIMDGSLTIGMLVGFQVLAASFLAPVNQMVALGSTMQEVESDMKRIDDVLQHDVAPEVLSATAPPDETSAPPSYETSSRSRQLSAAKLSGRLELNGVTFGYSPLEPPLIQDFSLRLSPGMRVALVGGSGSGKSTVARLVCGLHAPWDGDVLFDGRPRTAIDPDVMATSFSVVDQQIFLFKDTVRNNLSLWDTTIPESDLVQAARDACIHDEIVSRPGGYDRILAEDGSNFSGGQRQRLEIARALATNPSIVILDEATSALDPTTEKAIDDHLRRRGCTCLIVAHRLSTIRDCDEILVLDAGSVVQRGRHDDLIRDGGPYAALLDSM